MKSQPINMQHVWREDIANMFPSNDMKLTVYPEPQEPVPTPVSPYHTIRIATTGSTAPFINMPLGTGRVYVERIG